MSDKYKLVPVEPTEKMLNAGLSSSNAEMSEVVWIYEAMLAAAPEVEHEPVAWARMKGGKVADAFADRELAEFVAGFAANELVPLYLHPQPAPDVSCLTEALRQYQHNDGSGLMFGYDKLLVDRYVAGLVEALECALETMENVDGANDCSRGIDAVEEALAAHRKQGGES